MPAPLGRVLVTAGSVSACEAAIRLMSEAGCDVTIEEPSMPFDEDRIVEQVRDQNVLVFAMEPVTARVIDAAPALKLIARPGVGFDTVDLNACNRRRIPVTIAAGCNDQSVADFAMGLIIMAARQMLAPAIASRTREWERRVGTEIWNKTLTIVGLGRTGRALARRALGFDLRVLGVARPGSGPDTAVPGVETVDLETGFREGDFVSLHVPLTADTENLINERTIALMKPGAILVNTARGALIDEPALAQAVAAGRLAGAAVDVLRQQGSGSPSPLIGVPNIVVTPHMAGFSREAMERVALSVAGNVVRTLRGDRPQHLVNPEIYES